MAKKSESELVFDQKVIMDARHYTVEIEGVAPVLFNRPLMEMASKGESKSQVKEDYVEKERRIWRDKLYHSESVGLYFPAENVHEALKWSASYWGEKVSGSRGYASLVKAGLIPEELIILKQDGSRIEKDDEDVIIPFDKLCNGNPKGGRGGSLVWKRRPMVLSWIGRTTLHVNDARLTKDVLKTLLSYAGAFNGMGDWRPNYGRFSLNSIDEV